MQIKLSSGTVTISDDHVKGMIDNLVGRYKSMDYREGGNRDDFDGFSHIEEAANYLFGNAQWQKSYKRPDMKHEEVWEADWSAFMQAGLILHEAAREIYPYDQPKVKPYYEIDQDNRY